jgi:hypothetical protein
MHIKMGWIKKFLGIKEEPIVPEVHPEIAAYGRMLSGDEDECEQCHKPIFRDTEKWTKLHGHYFHRKCWKEGAKKYGF